MIIGDILLLFERIFKCYRIGNSKGLGLPGGEGKSNANVIVATVNAK